MTPRRFAPRRFPHHSPLQAALTNRSGNHRVWHVKRFRLCSLTALVLVISLLRSTAQTTPAPLIRSFNNPTPYYNEAFGSAVAFVGNELLAISAPGDGEPPAATANGSVY